MTNNFEPQRCVVAEDSYHLNWDNGKLDVCDAVEERDWMVKLRDFTGHLWTCWTDEFSKKMGLGLMEQPGSRSWLKKVMWCGFWIGQVDDLSWWVWGRSMGLLMFGFEEWSKVFWLIRFWSWWDGDLLYKKCLKWEVNCCFGNDCMGDGKEIRYECLEWLRTI